MIQAYSSNIDFVANAPIPLNNVALDKGCAETLSAPATLEINKRGVYAIEVNGYGTGATTGTAAIQLYKDGVALTGAQSQFTVNTTTPSNFSFQTLIQVQQNNCKCNCLTNPTILQVMNGDTALTDAYINVVLTRIC